MRTSLLQLAVLLIATPVRGEKPVSDVIATSAGQDTLEPLFTAVLQYQSDSPKSAVVPSEGRDGAFIGTSDGTVSGTQLRGTVRTSLWSGNCVYPLVRTGQPIPEGLHICTMNPVGFIETSDGARIRYAWLTKTIGMMEGDFDEKAGRAIWNVHVPADSHR